MRPIEQRSYFREKMAIWRSPREGDPVRLLIDLDRLRGGF
jgi:hypothetical protein